MLCRTVEIRITATGNIAKITKAMKMVAAAKLRAVQDKNELARPFTDGARDFLEPYAEVMDEIPEADVLKHVIVPITGDRGLCGGINTNIAKYVKAMVDQDSNDEIAVIAVGQKGEDGVQKFVPADQFVVSFRDVGGKFPMSFTQACVVAEDIVTQEYDKMTMVYTNYKNALVQTPMSFTVPSKSFMEDNPEKLEVRRQKTTTLPLPLPSALAGCRDSRSEMGAVFARGHRSTSSTRTTRRCSRCRTCASSRLPLC